MKTEQATPTRQETLKAVLHYFYQDNTHSGSHCRYNLKYHLVWCPKYAPAKVVQIFKGISSRRMRQEFLDIIRVYIWKEGTLWAVGYYVGSVGDGVTTELIREYINNQKAEAENPTTSASTQGKLFV